MALVRKIGVQEENYSDIYSAWAFRIWHGMTLKAWLSLLLRNRFAISPARIPMVIDVTLCAFANSICGAIQRIVYGPGITQTRITTPPVFIIGHWRTGTTWLHEMLALDPRFAAPTTYECFVPSHALLTAPIWILSQFRAPKRRPMDGMRVSYELPQEDEFALLNLGARSFLETFAFPNHRPIGCEYIDISSLSSQQKNRWIAARRRFIKQTLYRHRRDALRKGQDCKGLRPLLKSPQDTSRLQILDSVFEGACFIHLVRNPEDVFASTVKLWSQLGESQALHRPDWRARPDGTQSLEKFVLSTFERLYENFEASRKRINSDRFIDVRYEDLTSDPIAQLQRIYARFGWTNFDAMRPSFLKYLGENTRPKVNYRLNDPLKAVIADRLHKYREAYGYGAIGKKPEVAGIV